MPHAVSIQVLEIERRVLSPEHPSTLVSMANLCKRLTATTSTTWNNGETRKLIFGEMQSSRKGSGQRRWFRTIVICAVKKNGEIGVSMP